MWYTVIVESAQTQHARELLKDVAKRNDVEQWVLFDGPARRRDVMDLVRSLVEVPDFLRVMAYSGKGKGKLIADVRYREGGK